MEVCIKPAVFTDLTPQESATIQEALITIGCRWQDGRPKVVKHTEFPCISVDDDGTLHYHVKNKKLYGLRKR